MSGKMRILIVAVVVLAAATVLAVKRVRGPKAGASCCPGGLEALVPGAAAAAKIPRLVDLGADRCKACKMMAPVLDSLRRDFAGRMSVEFIDVWENPERAEEHSVKIIPTQIFFDASGRELFRHEGFFSRDEILAKWQELGITLEPAG